MKLRSFAGQLAGVRKGLASLTVYTCTHKDRMYGPTFDATCPLLALHAAWLSDRRTSACQLRAA
eukprot:8899171-Pyramimonas_sp.AAC.1